MYEDRTQIYDPEIHEEYLKHATYRFQGTGSKVPEPVPKQGTRKRFLNIVSLTHGVICVLYPITSLYSSIMKAETLA